MMGFKQSSTIQLFAGRAPPTACWTLGRLSRSRAATHEQITPGPMWDQAQLIEDQNIRNPWVNRFGSPCG